MTADMTTAEIIALEDAHQLETYAKLPLALVRGEGCWVWDADGRRFLDMYGGHCVALLGHCHPRLVKALTEQASKLIFYSNVVYNDARARAAQAVAGLAPAGLGKVFFCNSGSEANETALKIARKHTGRRRIVSMVEGFHGRTLGALAATGMERYRDPAYPLPAGHSYVPYGDLEALITELSGSGSADPSGGDVAGGDVAAVLLEPIPSMGGIRVAPDSYFAGLRELCDDHGAQLIFDEVQTGFGRTGTNFFGEQVGITPDMITGAKGAAGGVPAGVVLVRETVAAGVGVGEQGTTFGGGPLACAALEAVARTLVDDELPARAEALGRRITSAAMELDGVLSVAGRGLLLGLNLDRPAKGVVAALREKGVLSGGCVGLPNQLRLLPPLVLSDGEADLFLAALGEVLA